MCESTLMFCRGQNRASDPLDLELQTVVSCHMGVRTTPRSWAMFLTAGHLSSHNLKCFNLGKPVGSGEQMGFSHYISDVGSLEAKM